MNNIPGGSSKLNPYTNTPLSGDPGHAAGPEGQAPHESASAAASLPSQGAEPGSLIMTQSVAFQKYYQALLAAEKQGDRTAAIDREIANDALLETLEHRELGHSVWLLRNGADSSLLSSFTPASPEDEDFVQVLTIMSQHPETAVELKPEDLDKMALDLGYGYKAANLQVIQTQLKEIQKKVVPLEHSIPEVKGSGKVKKLISSELSVPEFKGISHFEIRSFLRKQCPDIEGKWKAFLDTFAPGQKEAFLSAGPEDQVDLLIPPEGQEILRSIQKSIVHAFSETLFSHVALAELVDSSNPKWVIVRSTGREDSKDNANAGGNDSIPFIAPEPEAVSKAIGKVVASYFGAKSVIQRLQAKDKSLFTAEPFMPVLLQKMVCEESAGGIGSKDIDIPCSGVLFTREQGKDPDVVTINAARGSNEGVVASQVVTDTYQVHPNGVYSTVRVQPTRFVHIPNENGHGYHVGSILNQEAKISHGPALSSQMVRDLAILAKELGRAYAEGDEETAAMDMEFTVMTTFDQHSKTKRTVIYPLQIRPLQETKKSEPSFINSQRLAAFDPKGIRQAKGATLLDGGSEVRCIVNPELETIVTDDIKEALHLYQTHPSVKDLKAIIIRQPAPLTSHECVTLRPKGVPVIVIEDGEAYLRAQTLLQDASQDAPTLLCPQRAVTYQTGTGEETAELISSGLISYPGPVELSLKNPSVMSLHPSNLDPKGLEVYLAGIDQEIKACVEGLVEAPLADTKVGLQELFDRMALSGSKEAKRALALYLLKMQSLYHNTLQSEEADKMLVLEMAECMRRIVKLSRGHVLTVIEKEKAQSMQRLFPLKQLQALTVQKSRSQVVKSASLLSLHQAIENCKLFSPAKFGLPDTALSKVLMTVASEGTREEYREKWYAFLSKVYKAKGEKGLWEVRKIVSSLRELELTTYWFNVTFQDYANPTLEQVTQDIAAEEKLFAALKEHHTALVGLQQSVPNWGDPEFFQKRFASFDKSFAALGFDGKQPSTLAARYAEANTLGKAAILEFFHKAMETYDESIKSVTGSGLFSSKKEQAEAFASMLDRYFAMLKTSMEIAEPFREEIVKLDGHNARQSQKQHHLDQFDTILTYLRDKDFTIQRKLNNPSPDRTVYYGKSLNSLKAAIKGMSEAECEHLFEARENFNVAAISLGSHTDLTFCIYWPKTLEELFTTTHQSMESLLKTMKTKVGMDKSRLPDSILPVCEGIESQTKQSIAKMSVANGILDVVYHIPFRSHASEVLIRTDLNQPEKGYQLHMTVFGNEETNRWKMTGAFASLLAQLPGCSFLYGAKPKINYLNPVGMGASFAYQMTPEFKNSSDFGAMFRSLLMSGGITYDASDSSPNGLIKGVAQMDGFKEAFPHLQSPKDWLQLPESYFANTLFPNLFLLNTALSAGEPKDVTKVVKGTLLAMASYGHPDVSAANVGNWSRFAALFTKGGGQTVASLYQKYKADIPASVLSSRYPEDKSYLKALLFTILHLHKTSPADAQEVLAFLGSHPKTKGHFKALINDLELLMVPVEDIVQGKIDSGDYSGAFCAAYACKEKVLIDKASEAWRLNIPASGKKEALSAILLDLAIGNKDELDAVISVLGIPANDHPEIHAQFANMQIAGKRKLLLEQLPAIGKEVVALGSKGLSKALVEASRNALIGLSQSGNFEGTNAGHVKNLGKYLGISPYREFLLNNVHSTSSKLFKAATFYILDALVSSKSAVRETAEQAVKDLAADHTQYGESDPSGKQALNCLFTILAGYRHQKGPGVDLVPLLNGNTDLAAQFESFWVSKMGEGGPAPSSSGPVESEVKKTPELPRKAFLDNLPQQAMLLYALGQKPLSEELFATAAHTLIGLSQSSDFVSKSIKHYYEGLSDYLGMAPYEQLLINNKYKTTRKLYKAAAFYLLKGLHSGDVPTVVVAEKAVKQVVQDYLQHGASDPCGKYSLHCIMTIAAGYLQKCPGADIEGLLLNHPELNAQFAALWKHQFGTAVGSPSTNPAGGVASPRVEHYQNLSTLGEEIRLLGMLSVSSELLSKSKETLIGLSQSTDFLTRSASNSYKGIENYLGKPPYKELLEKNIYTTTTKLYKAASFYILKGLHSNKADVRAHAESCLKELVEDYLQHGSQDSSGKSLQNAILAIAKAYVLQVPEADIPGLFCGNAELMAAYKQL